MEAELTSKLGFLALRVSAFIAFGALLGADIERNLRSVPQSHRSDSTIAFLTSLAL